MVVVKVREEVWIALCTSGVGVGGVGCLVGWFLLIAGRDALKRRDEGFVCSNSGRIYNTVRVRA